MCIHELHFFAALCSVAVSIVLKQFKQRDYAVLQMIVWNYVTASILCWLWFKPDFTHLSLHATPWWLIGLLGMLLPTIFSVWPNPCNMQALSKPKWLSVYPWFCRYWQHISSFMSNFLA
jgi:hypothetical protein